MTLLFCFLIGVLAGLRSLTPPAATAWAVYLGWQKLNGPLAWIGTLPSAIVLTLLAAGEFIADKLPKTPARTAPLGLSARIVTGALCGACIALGHEQSLPLGALLGSAGGVAGCFGGYQMRMRLVKALAVKDVYVAVVEDFVAIGGSLWVLSQH